MKLKLTKLQNINIDKTQNQKKNIHIQDRIRVSETTLTLSILNIRGHTGTQSEKIGVIYTLIDINSTSVITSQSLLDYTSFNKTFCNRHKSKFINLYLLLNISITFKLFIIIRDLIFNFMVLILQFNAIRKYSDKGDFSTFSFFVVL